MSQTALDRPGSETAGPDRITALGRHDVRFPTSRELDGSDAMNPFPDYSAAYVVAADERRVRPATGSPSRSGAATTCRPPASRRSSRWSSVSTSTTCSPTWVRSAGG